MDVNEAMKLSMERYEYTFYKLAQYEAMEKYCEVNNISIDDIDWESYSEKEKDYFKLWNNSNNLIKKLINNTRKGDKNE